MKYRPKQRWVDELECEVESPQITVFERDDGVPTGLLDKDGNELFRYEKIRIGFIKE